MEEKVRDIVMDMLGTSDYTALESLYSRMTSERIEQVIFEAVMTRFAMASEEDKKIVARFCGNWKKKQEALHESRKQARGR